MKRIAIILLLLSSSLVLPAQDRRDSIYVSPSRVTVVIPSVRLPAFITESETPESFRFTGKRKALPADSVLSISFRQKFEPLHPGISVISSWRNGTVTAQGSITDMPGLMAIESGSLDISHTHGNFSYRFYGTAVKYGYFNGLQTSYGIGADVTYRFNERLSMTVFGSYYSSVKVNNPAFAGYVDISNFGGFLDYSFSDKFGIQVGAQSYRSLFSRNREIQPIVKPYYKISSKASIGIDVGGIIYQLLKSNVGNNSWGRRNPTVDPPIIKMSEMMGY